MLVLLSMLVWLGLLLPSLLFLVVAPVVASTLVPSLPLPGLICVPYKAFVAKLCVKEKTVKMLLALQ